MTTVINLDEAMAKVTGHWTPKLAGRVNGTDVRLVRLQGDFDWHSHANEDELFLVLKGEMRMAFRDRIETVRAGEFIIVPQGTEHCPGADEECHVMLIEPSSVVNTGDNPVSERTVQTVEPLK
ncbi:MAG: cupin domain-containing protein [Pseudomonadota bacterium]